MLETKRIPYAELSQFTENILASVHANNDQGAIFSKALIWSDLIGRPTHGVWRLPAYTKRIDLGLIKCPCVPKFDVDNKSIGIMNADEGIGHYAAHISMERAIDKAREFGVGAIGVHNSNHFGTAAYYVQLAAEQNMIGLAVSNSIAKVAPFNGVNPVFGTNPFAFSAPRKDGKSIIFDMATTAIAGSQVMKLAEQGKPLPEGIAIDREGQPILDPNNVDQGTLLPFGGAKGYGLSLMIEILSSALTGAMFSSNVNSMFNNFKESGKNGHFFIAIDIGQILETEQFLERIEILLQMILNSGIELGDVMIPGETRWEKYHENIEQGVPLDQKTIGALQALAKERNVSTPF